MHNQRKLPLGLIVMVPVIAGFALYAFTAQQEPVEDPAQAAADATATINALLQTVEASGGDTPDLTPTPADASMQTAIAADRTAIAALTPQPADAYVPPAPPPPEAYATPTPVVRGQFREGAIVRVNVGEGDCLNVRNMPATNVEYSIVNACLPNGHEGYLAQGAEGYSGAPYEPDGSFWWLIAGAGWVSEEYIEYVRDGDLSIATAPRLAGTGRIAYVRDEDIWLMDADGGNQRMIVDRPKFADQQWTPGPERLRWSPDGTMLSYNVQRASDDGQQTYDLHIVRLAADGNVASATEYAGMMGDNWSPGSNAIGVIAVTRVDGMGGGYFGSPGVLDVLGGQAGFFGEQEFAQTNTPAFNFDGSLLLVAGTPWNGEADNDAIRVWDLNGREVARIEQPGEGKGWYSSPRWSPVDNRIGMHSSETTDGTTYRPVYAVYDLAGARIVASAPVPDYSPKAGGKCGGIDMWRMEWSRDGSHILYQFDMGDNGANGIWAWDIATGEQKLVPTFNAGNASAGPDGWFAFTVGGGPDSYIVVGHEGGGYPQPIAEGASPAWSPR